MFAARQRRLRLLNAITTGGASVGETANARCERISAAGFSADPRRGWWDEEVIPALGNRLRDALEPLGLLSPTKLDAFAGDLDENERRRGPQRERENREREWTESAKTEIAKDVFQPR